MTRQHFKALAEALKIAKPSIHDTAEIQCWKRTVRAVANACHQFNPGFKTDKFYEACDYQ